jgi:hypothetical protein
VRSADHQARVELLFFPTGGGKTEAYLGLAAYTFAIRRRQGVIESAEGPLDGRDGVAVLMRYTLRLLTAQQFQRATALVCAAELARREDEATWGVEPFRIGLWVGTDVSPKRFEEADEQLTKANEYGSHRLTVLQIQRCPWCGTPITAAQVKADATMRRVFVYCGDDLARCPFAKGGQVTEGLPVLTVDEEIYRLTPAFVIATVDKFARLARGGRGRVAVRLRQPRCGRHGYVHPDYAKCDIPTTHPRRTAPGGSRAAGHAAAPARPDHPGRAAPHHRCLGHVGRPVRGGRRDVVLVGDPRRQTGAATDRRLHGDGPQRHEQVRVSTGDRWRSSRPRCSTSPTPTSPKRFRSTERTQAAATSVSAPRACASRAPRSGLPRSCCRPASCCSTGQAPPPTRT